MSAIRFFPSSTLCFLTKISSNRLLHYGHRCNARVSAVCTRFVRGAHDQSGLRVNQGRLMQAIHDGCKHGEAHRYGSHPTETGMARLSLNDADKEIRDWFRQIALRLGCRYTVDQMGNQFAVRPGESNSPAAQIPIMMGSHLDTQPTGGRYDGILGVTAGLEVLQVLQEHEFCTKGAVGVVNWTNEEGARFPKMAVSSAVWAEAIPLQDAWRLREVTPSQNDSYRTMKEELERIGYLGTLPASYRANPFAAHFELHIEQGPILEKEKKAIGVVEGAQAFKWFEITVTGRDSHAGTTPFDARKDAMLCTAKCILQSNQIAKEYGGLATTGIVRGTPQAVNTMPHTVAFTLDLRHTSDEQLAALESSCRSRFAAIAHDDSELGCYVNWTELVDSPAVRFHADCIEAVKSSAIDTCRASSNWSNDGGAWKYMVSGAGHDSCYANRRCPTSMIFVPTKDGISHNPREFCSPEDCAIGAQVLLGAVLRYDQLRSMRGVYS